LVARQIAGNISLAVVTDWVYKNQPNRHSKVKNDPTKMKLHDLQLRKTLELVGRMQETMKEMVENSCQMVCKCDNLLEIVQELEQEEAKNE
jgi:hypothetical protein